MTETRIDIDGVVLCAETFGSPDDPTVLLIAGGGQSMVWWEDGFCERLAAAQRQVIRYDHRDTGRSTSSPAGRPTYAAPDLATDPLRVLDALGATAAHLVGLSLGGGLAQSIAVTQPHRVRSLTLIATTSAGPGADRPLPPPSSRVASTFTDPQPEPDWTDRDAVVAYRVDVERPYAGALGFDEDRFWRLADAEVTRTTDMAASLTNHFILDGDAWPAGMSMAQIGAPTLVLHGTTDPMFPAEHGMALARAIRGARFLPLEGMGHQQPPPSLWDVTTAAIRTHTEVPGPSFTAGRRSPSRP